MSIRREIRDASGVLVGHEHATDFPGGEGDCHSGVVVSHGAFIYEGERGKGLGQLAHEARLERFRREGFNYALCTVARSNDAQLHILKKNGWVRLASTASDNGTPIYLMGKNLR